jgi:hypothetical protein
MKENLILPKGLFSARIVTIFCPRLLKTMSSVKPAIFKLIFRLTMKLSELEYTGYFIYPGIMLLLFTTDVSSKNPLTLIDVFYNMERRHSTLDYKILDEFKLMKRKILLTE